MNPEAQNKAIVKALGWTTTPSGVWTDPNGKTRGGPWHLPNHLNDLNACHEMEKSLTRYEHMLYISTLCAGLNEPHVATASQRCKAFLKSLNLWTK